MKTKQPKSKFYSAASRLLSLGGDENDVREKALDYEIDEAGVNEWLKNRIKS